MGAEPSRAGRARAQRAVCPVVPLLNPSAQLGTSSISPRCVPRRVHPPPTWVRAENNHHVTSLYPNRSL